MSPRTKTNSVQALKNWFMNAERVVIAGIGNPIRMDDFVGVKIVQSLKARVSEKVFLIECETVPENFIQQIVDFNPTHILLIDAALLELGPGEWELVKPQKLIDSPAYSTHMLPLRMFCEYLSDAIKAKIALILIQPKATDFGEGLSPEVNASVQKIVKTLLEASPRSD